MGSSKLIMRLKARSKLRGLCALVLLTQVLGARAELAGLPPLSGYDKHFHGLPYFLGGAPLDIRLTVGGSCVVTLDDGYVLVGWNTHSSSIWSRETAKTHHGRRCRQAPNPTEESDGATRASHALNARTGQNDVSNVDVPVSIHTADGPGLHTSCTGCPSTFTIRLGGGEHGTAPQGGWDIGGKHFVYVSIVSTDHVFSANVEDNGNGTLTATYESSFPGDYLVFVQEVDMREPSTVGRVRRIKGSPFSLTISGEPTVDARELHLCDTEGYSEDISSTFWRTGSWVTSKYASAEHGVLRDGWVFQPNDCVYDIFSHDDIMLLAGLEEPMWLLITGNSVQRSIFHTLVDLVLAAGQKNNFNQNVIRKCWGMVDFQIGHLRLTYQDIRLYEVQEAVEDSIVCHERKLATRSTAEYISSTEQFFEQVIFKENEPWPNVIMAPSHLVDTDVASNPQISVLLAVLPSEWDGSLIMMEHMAGLGYFFDYDNPTALSLAKVKPKNMVQQRASADVGLRRMEAFQRQDPRLSFLSVFPIHQARFFESEKSRTGKPCYGCSPHYHYVSSEKDPEAWHGAKMVHSDTTEMIANIFISKAVGKKSALYQKAASILAANESLSVVQPKFQVCADCPAALIPYHVKAMPDLTCVTETRLGGKAAKGVAWGGKKCPRWCNKDNTSFVSHAAGVLICPRKSSRRE